MLHIWDQNYMGKGMLHGQSLPDGSFLFTDVPIELNSIYAVMANYDGATYLSEPIVVESENTLLDFEVPIYETTADPSAVVAEQAHVLFSFEQGGLFKWEVYTLSNSGEYTVKDVISLDDGSTATFKFDLPDDAANVSFESDNGDRFIQYSGGFADTNPIAPGIGSTQIIVSYILPYEDVYTYFFQAPMDVNSVRFLVVDDPGITFDGDSLVSDEPQTMQDGTKFFVYSRDGVAANDAIEVVVSGKPEYSAPLVDTIETKPASIRSSNLEIGIGVLVLGVVLVIAGVWWWRKPIPDIDDDIDLVLDDSDFKVLVRELVELDENFNNGEISAEDYDQRRVTLVAMGKELLYDQSTILEQEKS
jgi:hypothetical protein